MIKNIKTVLSLAVASAVIIIVLTSFTTSGISFGLNKGDVEQTNQSGKLNPTVYDYPIVVGQPNYYPTTLIYNKTVEAGFVQYEDFPIESKILSHYGPNNIKPVGIYDNNIWTKLLRNDTGSSNSSQIILRVLGAVKPFTPNPFNQTLYMVMTDETKNQTYTTSIPIIRNSIMSEVFVVNGKVPIKFKNEIFALKNGTLPHIFGVVYDPGYEMTFASKSPASIHVNIQPVGVINNVTMTAIPPWLEIKPLQLSLSLTQDQPDYFAFLISTKNAPEGSYEIALRENISGKIFIETINLTILE